MRVKIHSKFHNTVPSDFSILDGTSLRCDDAHEARREVLANLYDVILVHGFPSLICCSLHNFDIFGWQGAHALNQVVPAGVVLK